jgi:hypothetical protein
LSGCHCRGRSAKEETAMPVDRLHCDFP